MTKPVKVPKRTQMHIWFWYEHILNWMRPALYSCHYSSASNFVFHFFSLRIVVSKVTPLFFRNCLHECPKLIERAPLCTNTFCALTHFGRSQSRFLRFVFRGNCLGGRGRTAWLAYLFCGQRERGFLSFIINVNDQILTLSSLLPYFIYQSQLFRPLIWGESCKNFLENPPAETRKP